ncbi:MAG TPA: hypothetical protein VG898_12495, partial [Solirubrobacterales bacterium]|nr:hypothetical protein [Solirubrobacterales bacterium]
SRQQANPNMDASGSASGSFVGSAIRPPDFIYLDDADYAVSGKTTKLRLRVQVAVNPTKAALKFTFGLYPITPEGSAKTLDFVAGELVTGSSAVVNEPAALGISQTASGDFNVPADGLYAICVTTSAALTENSAVVCAAQLQVRHT